MERLQKCFLKATFYSSITNPATRFVNNVVYTGVGLAGALAAVVAGRISVRVRLLSYANQYTKPFNEISGVVTELQNAGLRGAHFDLSRKDPRTEKKWQCT